MMIKKKAPVIGGAILLICSLALSGCNYKEFEDNIKGEMARKQEEEQIKVKESEKESEKKESIEAAEAAGEDIKETLVFNPGEYSDDKGVQGITYTVTNAEFYKNYKEAGVAAGDMDQYSYDSLEEVQDRGFILVDVTVDNESHVDYSDGSINVSCFYLIDTMPEKLTKEEFEMSGNLSDANYFEQHMDGETDYWHLDCKAGETADITFGFFVRTDSMEETAKRYKISWMGDEHLSGALPFNNGTEKNEAQSGGESETE